MELINTTPFAAEYSAGILKSGNPCIVVVAKATFDFSRTGKTLKIAESQQPIIESDSYIGEPGKSSLLLESEFAPMKHKCDVILVDASAQLKPGEASPSIDVGLVVEGRIKTFRIWGERRWKKTQIGWEINHMSPVEKTSIIYENAWGGSEEDVSKKLNNTVTDNPVGTGFYDESVSDEVINNSPLPRIESCSNKKSQIPKDILTVCGFGPIARNWTPRCRYAGTFDEDWFKHKRPFLPDDFDERFYQCAPEDQQFDKLMGGEEIGLINLTEEPEVWIRIPEIAMQLSGRMRDGREIHEQPKIDTLIINPPRGQIQLIWRSYFLYRYSIREIDNIIVGKNSQAWKYAVDHDIPYLDLKLLNYHSPRH